MSQGLPVEIADLPHDWDEKTAREIRSLCAPTFQSESFLPLPRLAIRHPAASGRNANYLAHVLLAHAWAGRDRQAKAVPLRCSAIASELKGQDAAGGRAQLRRDLLLLASEQAWHPQIGDLHVANFPLLDEVDVPRDNQPITWRFHPAAMPIIQNWAAWAWLNLRVCLALRNLTALKQYELTAAVAATGRLQWSMSVAAWLTALGRTDRTQVLAKTPRTALNLAFKAIDRNAPFVLRHGPVYQEGHTGKETAIGVWFSIRSRS